MKKTLPWILASLLFVPVWTAQAAEDSALEQAATEATLAQEALSAPAPESAAPAPIESTVPSVGDTLNAAAETGEAVDAPAEEPVLEPELADNLEFISGEVSALDEAAKSITVKLYGETEQAAAEKTLSVTVDDATDITDGEKDRDLKSLTAGTEVDVEYDSKTNKATYIFVY